MLQLHKGVSGEHAGVAQLQVTGEMTIQHVPELRDALCEMLAEHEQVVVSLDGIERIDLAGLQILCAAHQSATLHGKLFSVIDSPRGLVAEGMREAGLSRHTGCSRDRNNSCIWLNENVDGRYHP